MAQCCQCGRPAMFLVGEEGQQVPLCLSCRNQFLAGIQAQCDLHEREINYIASWAEAIGGVPGSLPRFPERRIPAMNQFNFNNINVDRSNIGVLNTGSIGSVDGAVGCLKEAGYQEVAEALSTFTTEVVNSQDASDDLKNQIIELLSAIAEEAATPTENRRPAVTKSLLSEVSNLVTTVSSLGALWAQYGPAIQAFFGF